MREIEARTLAAELDSHKDWRVAGVWEAYNASWAIALRLRRDERHVLEIHAPLSASMLHIILAEAVDRYEASHRICPL